MKVKCFGIARDIIAADQIQVIEKNPVSTVGALKCWIKNEYPAMKSLNGFLIAVNQEYAEDDLELKAMDEIAIIPPVSGG